MRCNNCGWNNADDAETCVKCNNPLMETVRAARGSQKETVRSERPVGDFPLEREALGGGQDRQAIFGGVEQPGREGGLVECPYCNYPANRLVEDCPSCGRPMKAAEVGQTEVGQTLKSEGRQRSDEGGEAARSGEAANTGEIGERTRPMRAETIDPFRNRQIVRTTQPEMVLEKVGRPDETSELIKFKAAGDQVTVNRANLDEGNFTITGRVQATFTFRDNKWWLQDGSELKTTFIQVKEPRELKDGDIVLMGDRRFIFYSSDAGKTGDATP
jgi:Double zinc ribbon